MTNPLDEADLRSRIQQTLESFIADHSEVVAGISADADPLIGSLAAMVSGGKRLRPAFAYWGMRSAGGTDSEAAVRAFAALEFLQACALIHDDVMDASDTRRGMPAVHKQFELLHRDEQWHGDAAAFGAGAAILIGDLALSWADELIYTSGLSQDELARVKPVYDVMRTELMAGQYLDLLEQARRSASVEQAKTVIRFKSAKYTIERPLLIGAAVANASAEHQQALSTYGLALGEAFQLRDDVLGVFGDSATTGKPAGDDLRERKQTVLLALALDDAQRALRISQLMESDHLNSGDIAELQVLIRKSGAIDEVERMIDDAVETALNAIADFDDTSRQALTELAIMSTRRES